ncbi:hypothetical protein Tco_1285464 [Tanacetum coccineum]
MELETMRKVSAERKDHWFQPRRTEGSLAGLETKGSTDCWSLAKEAAGCRVESGVIGHKEQYLNMPISTLDSKINKFSTPLNTKWMRFSMFRLRASL